MAKDSYWFRHDSTAGRGLKMRKMAHIYNHWGKGVYWDVIEILRDQENYCFESDNSSLQLLCDLIGCKDEKKFLNWFADCLNFGLFLVNDGYFVCPPLSENMANWEIKKANGSKGGRPKKTETKPNPKPNQKHKRTEEKIIEDNNINNSLKEIDVNESDDKIKSIVYEEENFLINWNEIRTYQLGTKSNLNKLKQNESDLFFSLKDQYKKEDFHIALNGLFNQEKVPSEIMWFRPKHFLENIETYIDAQNNKKYKLYG